MKFLKLYHFVRSVCLKVCASVSASERKFQDIFRMKYRENAEAHEWRMGPSRLDRKMKIRNSVSDSFICGVPSFSPQMTYETNYGALEVAMYS